jgi:translation initiation factor 2 beta subunit (eIF-2beta)/eIF-5
MCFGIETGDGWYSLIDCLCKQIQSECDKSTSEYQVFAIQVKEKFGGLRFYTYNSTEEIEKYITFAENLSYYICSICGKMDETVTQTKGWIITLCEECKNSKANNR